MSCTPQCYWQIVQKIDCILENRTFRYINGGFLSLRHSALLHAQSRHSSLPYCYYYWGNSFICW
ncbi:hypothetical protein GQ44DRAFT_709951 [Phaeosphaeriaceae sp. PMI808]|nr:hypothetical protein GQ44DRAFT_709951 [Phaeosphaeriaceae sp. PMI808]